MLGQCCLVDWQDWQEKAHFSRAGRRRGRVAEPAGLVAQPAVK